MSAFEKGDVVRMIDVLGGDVIFAAGIVEAVRQDKWGRDYCVVDFPDNTDNTCLGKAYWPFQLEKTSESEVH